MDLAGINPLYSLAGVAVGLLVGMTGVGGGSLMTPLLVLAFGFHPATAVGTDLLYAAATKSVGTVVHGVGGTVDWKVVRRLLLGSMPATLATLFVLARVGAHVEQTAHVITFVLGLALIATAVAILFRARIVAYFAQAEAQPQERPAWMTVVLGGGAGAAGVAVFGRRRRARHDGAAGALPEPADQPPGRFGHRACGAADADRRGGALVPRLGRLALLGSLLVGSVPGIIVGSLLATRVSDRVLRPILAVTLAIVGGKLVF